MLDKQRQQLVKLMVSEFLADSEEYPTITSINEGSCGFFAHAVNETFENAGLQKHTVYSTFDFMSPDSSGLCEYLVDWKEEAMLNLGCSPEYFVEYRKKVEAVDNRGVVGYHVWLSNGDVHYDATCSEGVKNALELPFFQQFTRN